MAVTKPGVSQVIIVGGGIAGLSAAYELYRRGISFTLLEAGGRAGGVVLSEQIDGFTIDAGPDSLLVQKPEGIRLCKELGLGGSSRRHQTSAASAYIQRGGRLHPLPAASVLGIPTTWGPFIRTPLFSWPGKAADGHGARIVRRASDDDESIGAFMERRFGTEAKEYLAEPLLAGIHAGRCRSVVDRPRCSRASVKSSGPTAACCAAFARSSSGDEPSARRRRRFSIVDRRAERSGQRAGPDAAAGVDTVADAGHGSVLQRIEVSRGDRGSGDLHRSRRPRLAGLRHRAHRPLIQSDDRRALRSGAVCVDRHGGAGISARRSGRIHSTDRASSSPASKRTGILAASWLSSKWPGRAPDDRVLMRTFIGGARDPKGFELDDDELVALSIDALRPLLGITGDPLFSRVYRWERASAQHEVGHLARLARNRGSARPPARAVHHRQRLSRRRDSRLRRRRTRHRGEGGRLAETPRRVESRSWRVGA